MKHRAAQTAAEIGALLLRNGAEVCRVEETIESMAALFGMAASCFATPTGLIVTFSSDDDDITIVRRIRHRSINLGLIARVMAYVASLRKQPGALGESRAELAAIQRTARGYSLAFIVVTTALTAALVTMGSGGWADVAIALVLNVGIQILLQNLGRVLPNAIGVFLGAMLVPLGASLLARLQPALHPGPITAGAIVTLLPGITFATAVRDGIYGNLLASISFGVEAAVEAASLAGGVASGLLLAAKLGAVLR